MSSQPRVCGLFKCMGDVIRWVSAELCGTLPLLDTTGTVLTVPRTDPGDWRHHVVIAQVLDMGTLATWNRS